ncbi:Indigoidine synthase A like protein-domain-containing protein [Podospora fimiseda]|uniref:Indigoidine synthase A like protein-domain-containing protein n=1 Tax=Podospora fimiseda TaxID=252190 RepID=A0AAN7BWE1_9PEZI|nr:Indigoidine synthase A like protein-domain-containing protein [Podospora fimiseda]
MIITTRTLSRVQHPLKRTISRRHFSTPNHISPFSSLLKVSQEVQDALATNRPVVALESTIYTHGALGNELPAFLEQVVRDNGAVPATCGVLAGVPTVGLTPKEIEIMVNEGAKKLSRRDLAHIVGWGLIGQERLHGGTTISGTMILARAAGIRVFGTGGLGGVHQGGETSLDISADLTELGRTRVAVISSGCKGFLDIPRTLEFLETQGVLVATFAQGREAKDVEFPAFWARESGCKSPHVVQDEREAAAIILAQERLGIESGMLFPNAVPKEFEIPRAEMEEVIKIAVREADEQGVTGPANTPFILNSIRELTKGKSAPANKALVESNVERAAKVAVELAKLMDGNPVTPRTVKTTVTTKTTSYVGEDGSVKTSSPTVNVTSSVQKEEHHHHHQVDILVAGSVALDLNCDYSGSITEKAVSPALYTSNPSAINQSVGGVGHNIALAAHKVSDDGKIRLCSMVGDDIAGSTILSALQSSGLDTSYIRQLGHEYPSARTAQYVAVNDTHKNLVLAMADMAIFSTHSFSTYWNSAVNASKPKWLALDANWAESDIKTWIEAGHKHDAKIAFEPVSTAKARRLFPPLKKGGMPDLGLYPKSSIHLSTPNQYELLAMYEAARDNGYFESHHGWFEIIDAFGIMRGARDRFVDIAGVDLTDSGVPVQMVNLLPFIPTIITKLGDRGVLLAAVLGKDDERLRDPEEARYVVSRGLGGKGSVGGVYMRLFPAVERVREEDVVSVNGIGDTFMGVLIAGLAQGGELGEELIDLAQRAAVLTLKSSKGVSDEVGGLRRELRRVVGESE